MGAADVRLELGAAFAGKKLRRTVVDEMRKGDELPPVVIPTDAGTSINGPTTAASASPDPIPNVATATAICRRIMVSR